MVVKSKILFFGIALSYIFQSQSCSNMKVDFCQALASNNTLAIEKAVNSYLGSLNAKEDSHANFVKIQHWLESNSCIKSAEFIHRIIATRPPIAQFQFKLKEDNTLNCSYKLKIIFDIDYKFYQLLKEEKNEKP